MLRTGQVLAVVRSSALGIRIWSLISHSALLISHCALVALVMGCGTTRITDTQRTATEQLLVSHAVDQVVSQFDFRPLAAKKVFLDAQYLDGVVDRGYLISSIRQQLLACGCELQEDRTKATYVVEARAGGIGTDRHALLLGVPQMQVPALVPGQPSSIPEIPLAKKTDQKGVAKIAVFAYNRVTGRPVMQTGTLQHVSNAKDVWVFGAGPFQRGSIRRGTEFAGQPFQIPFVGDAKGEEAPSGPVVPVTQAAAWIEVEPGKPEDAATKNEPAKPPAAVVQPASGTTPAAPPAPTPPNTGGHSETQPARIMNSAFGAKPDGQE